MWVCLSATLNIQAGNARAVCNEPMPKAFKHERGTYTGVIPKGLGESLNLDGAEVEWQVTSSDTLGMPRDEE